MFFYAPQWMSFGKYVYLHTKDNFPSLYPLAECLIYAINDDQPVGQYLPYLFADGKLPTSVCDRDWNWWRLKQSDGSYIYHVWTDPKVSGLDPCEASYDEATIKLHVRRTLDHFRKYHPERSTDVEEVITRYQL